jgi:hypothetical protein
MSSWSQCHHPLEKEIYDHGTGDIICTGCGTVKDEHRLGYYDEPPTVVPFNGLDEHGGSKAFSLIPYTMALSEACQLLGLPTASLLVAETMTSFDKYCKALDLGPNRTFPTKLPILAYAFQRVLAENDIFRLTHVYASLFNLSPRRLLQAENEVCEALSLTPLYIAPSFLIETVCRWLAFKPVLCLTCRDLCKRVEVEHYGKNPEWIIYSVIDVICNRLPLVYPRSRIDICMSKVQTMLNLGSRPRKVAISTDVVDEELRRRPLI